MESYELAGTFWIPGAEEHRVKGRLLVGDQMRLALDGLLSPAMRTFVEEMRKNGGSIDDPSLDSESIVVHGELNSGPRKVSLFECLSIGGTGAALSAFSGTQVLRPLFGFRGTSPVADADHVTGVRVQLRHLAEWTRAPGFGMTMYSDGRSTLTYKPPEVEEAHLENGAVVRLAFSTLFENPDPSGATFRRDIAIEVAGFEPIDLRRAERLYTVPLSTLVTICLLRDSQPIALHAQDDGGEWFEVVAPYLFEADEEPKKVKPWNVMVSLPELGIAGVATWLNQVEKLGPLPAIVADAAGANKLRIETLVSEMTSVAEGLHKRILGNPDKPITRDRYKELRSKVLDALGDKDEDTKKAVVDGLQGLRRPSYRARLAELRDRVNEVVPEIFGHDYEAWAQQVADRRNEFAHQNTDFITPESSGPYAAVAYSVRWLLVALLLLETGISAADLREKIEENQRFQSFVDQAPLLLPEVYGRSDGRGQASGDVGA